MSTSDHQHDQEPTKRVRIDWSEAEIVFIRRPICPYCRSPEYHRTKSQANGDDSVTRKVVCVQCSTPYKICIELPVSGNDDETDL